VSELPVFWSVRFWNFEKNSSRLRKQTKLLQPFNTHSHQIFAWKWSTVCTRKKGKHTTHYFILVTFPSFLNCIHCFCSNLHRCLVQCTGHSEHLMWTPSIMHEVRETMKETWPILPLRYTRCCLDTYIQCLEWSCFNPALYSMPDSMLQCIWSVSWSWVLDSILNIPGNENSPLKG